MKLSLDHIVHFINRDPVEPMTEWKEQGYHAVMGGRHEHWGTHNSLIYFGLTYIEYLAIENLQIAEKSTNPLIKQIVKELPNGEGIGQICFRTNHIHKLKDRLKERGYDTSLIFEGSRKRDDGSLIEWKMLFILEEYNHISPYPFFIEWNQEDEERISDLKSRGIISEELTSIKIKSIYIPVYNLKETAQKWSSLFDIPVEYHSNSNPDLAAIHLDGLQIYFEAKDDMDKRGERPFLLEFDPVILKEGRAFFGTVYK